MTRKIKRPSDNYSADWIEYWKQNPMARKSVGADGTDDPPADPPDDPPTIDPAKYEEIVAAKAAVEDEVEKLRQKNKELLQARADAKKEAEASAAEAARKNGDVEALEKSLTEKFSKEIEELKSENAAKDALLAESQATISNMTVGAEAQKMASELSVPGSATVMQKHIAERLKMEMKDGKPFIRVLDKEGKPSANTVDELRKEFESDPAFAPLIIGSKANGSGGVGKKAVPGNDAVMKLSPIERMNAGRESKG